MTFGEKLQQLRQQAGWSQDLLAEQLDVSRQAVSRWERDETLPETEKVVRIAQLFDVSLDYLLRQEQEEAEKASPRNGEQTGQAGQGPCHGQDNAPSSEEKEERPLARLLRFLERRWYLFVGWGLIFWGLADILPLLFVLLAANQAMGNIIGTIAGGGALLAS